MEPKDICTNTSCEMRFDCKTFDAALDLIAGKIKHYNIIDCKNLNFYQKK